ncbi:MAG TPA: M15 family metallopeptidase [Tenericutes bacterium]|nr:M15 family metallopeptidase [Mycoplasmatota bacterium]
MDLNLIISLVNVNADYKFYTNVVNTDLDKDLLILVNKYNKLPSNYEPKNLVSLGDYGIGKMIDVAKEAFVQMAEDIKKEGLYIKSISSYRSYSSQESIYNRYVKIDGVEITDTYSARPGHSEHQTGLTVDINMVEDEFANTKEAKWLANNAHKYGFILRYPKNKEHITGYSYEPWHFRYVGKEVAKFIYENDITFDEYYAYYLK